ncbi:armadillo-type protein [Scheffersomyces coipomensis]|uniref:armadillo-type protein n=1 Tax=Scheffersomyces coipomensis TaxID=1788519 RepID=UPI00315C54B6
MAVKEKKVRGRRAQKKETSSNDIEGEVFKVSNGDGRDEDEEDQENGKSNDSTMKSTFFGLVDSNELDYFKQAESTLNINAFESDEERIGFIRSVLEEAKGKELKLVTNQICSKLMERLILSSNDKQVKRMFNSFLTHFVALAHHKYSSHVLETLFVRAAALIEKELIQDDQFKNEEDEEEEEDDDDEQIQSTMEELFIKMINEFKPHFSAMIDHQYSSHTLRLIILIVSGKELPSTTTSNSTLRSKKSKIARKMIEIKDNDDFNKSFQVPPSFKSELRSICQQVRYNQDTRKMREFAAHKVASPVLQLLIQVEGIVDKEREVWHLLFNKENADKDPQEEAFMEYLLSESVGSHFLEAVVKNDGVRLKYIERLYKLYMKDRILKLVNRSTSGAYIIQALLFKLKPVEVEHILDIIIPELSNLINNNLDLGIKIIEASKSRSGYRKDEIIEQLFLKFAPNYNIQDPQMNTSSEFLENTLQLASSTLGNTKDDWPTAEERRRSLFVQKLMEYDYKFIICVWYNFFALSVERFIQMCFHGVFNHIIEKSLVVEKDEPKPILILRKRLMNLFQNEIVKLSCNSYGSHIVDKLWDFTIFLPIYKDKIATELFKNSKVVKESTYGRLVWKNWSMELFARKKYDWKTLIKQQEQEFIGEDGERVKKPIELKLEKLAQEKKYKEEQAQREANQAYYKSSGHGKHALDDQEESSFEKKQKLRGRRR